MRYMFTLLMLGLCITLGAQTRTIYIDFGDDDTPTPSPWNNIVTDQATVTESITDLTNSDGDPTGISFALDTSNNFNQWANMTGEQSTTTDWNFPITATQDNLFGHGNFWGNCSCTHAEVHAEIDGLDPAIEYTFVMFGSRQSVTDIRSAEFELTGATTESASLNASQNTTNTASVSLMPDASGKIELVVSPADDNDNEFEFYFLGVLVITWEEAATSVMDRQTSELMKVFPNPITTSTIVHSPGMERLSLTNAIGERVGPIEIVNSDYYYLDLSDYPSGVYYIAAENRDGTVAVSRVVKN